MNKHKRQTVLVAFVLLFAVVILFKPEYIKITAAKAKALLSPIFIGMTIAFIMNRPVCRLEKIFKKLFCKLKEKHIQALSVLTCYIFLVGLISGIIFIVVPQLIKSVMMLAENYDKYFENFKHYYKMLERKDSFGIFKALDDSLNSFDADIPEILKKAYIKTSGIIGGIIDFLIGFVISIYILADKTRIKKAVSETLRAFTSASVFERTNRYYRLVFDTFGRFVSGQITEACVLGILCFAGMKLFRFEYALLISTLIGVTALIPVIGAFVGTIPSAFLLFLTNPMDAVWFIVFIIILQQFENNFIYPKIVGKSLGLPPLVILTAIIIGAGAGGVAGIMLGVPLSAVIYAVICDYVHQKNGTDKCELWQRGDEIL